MPFAPGQSGNPLGQIRAKPFREALRIEEALAQEGQPCPAPKGTLRYIARQMLERAGEDNGTAKEVADRMDGKPAQAVIGGDEDDPAINVVHRIERAIVDPSNSNS
jgi:hypothetical protein